MAIRHSVNLVFPAPQWAIINAVHAALTELVGRPPTWSPTMPRAVVMTGYNLLSYGEEVVVIVQPTGEVVVSSECSVPLQLVDWGKNKQNCQRVMRSVAKHLNMPPPLL